MHATYFGSNDNIQAIKYMILTPKNVYIFSVCDISQIVHVKNARHMEKTVTGNQVNFTLKQATKA
jgi:hypothetical protein